MATEQALELMLRFAERTGLTSGAPARRYLWTDAFAVCNFLALQRQDLATRLVAQVHSTLGSFRPGDHPSRRGRLSGLDEEQGEAHPTRGGLRIGKPLPEREPDAAPDPRLEWEQDGQYFHYLTKWMHALDKLTRATGDPRYTAWARELMETAHRAFLYSVPGRGRRMCWKMSIDLSRPLVSSQGGHDPLDGFVTCVQLEETADALGHDPGGLPAARRDFHSMLRQDAMATTDMLGIGGLLADASRLDQLRQELPLRDAISRAAAASVKLVAERGRDLDSPAFRRLAFRELGLAIGMAAADLMQDPPPEFRSLVQERYAFLRDKIQSFWLRPDSRRDKTYLEHEDINDVMLATSLAPDGFLRLGRAGA